MTDRELDALVAEKVFPERWCCIQQVIDGQDGAEHVRCETHGEFITCDFVGWSPSTSIADAWEVVEKIASDHKHFPEIHWRICENAYQHHCDIWYNDPKAKEHRWLVKDCYATTAPRAICLAALRAVGVEVTG